MIIKRIFSISELDQISVGDAVEDEFGKRGHVERIDILKRFRLTSYYFMLAGTEGTILILK